MSENQYADRDIMEQDEKGGYFYRHMNAMTAEGLHRKADIAAELARRDIEIDSLRSELSRLAEENDGLTRVVADMREALRQQDELSRIGILSAPAGMTDNVRELRKAAIIKADVALSTRTEVKP